MSKDIEGQLIQIGIDEVGRGPLAGPVAVGAFIILKPDEVKRLRIFRGVKESKQLSPEARERWFRVIKKAQQEGLIDFCVSFQDHHVIDTKGISYAITKSLTTSLEIIVTRHRMSHDQCQILLDGGLHTPVSFVHQKTIIRGDSKEQVIALASICAKVLRDRRMVKLAKKYPKYGFEIHKGYGTKMHRIAIQKYGFSAIHRQSFCKALQIRVI